MQRAKRKYRSGGRHLPWVVAHDGTNAVFSSLTFFGPVFVLFLAELGLPKTRIGVLLSFLPFCGLLAPFISSRVGRIGLKRVFMSFWFLRCLATACFLPMPWLVGRLGSDATFFCVAALVLLFALCRAIGETACFPWFQEIIPGVMRGRFTAVSGMVSTALNMAALGGASYAIAHFAGLERFTLLMGAGVVCGLVSIAVLFPVPGGAPRPDMPAAHIEQMRLVLRDPVFCRYLLSLGCVTLVGMVSNFVPLFMEEAVNLSEQQVLLLQIGTYVGFLFSSYAWGWAADRYGGKETASISLYLLILVPLGWLLMPRHSEWSIVAAMGLAVLGGAVGSGWWIGNNRLLYVNLVPPERKEDYMAIYYAWMGLVGGCGPLAAGAAVDYCQGLQGEVFLLHLDAYTPLFVAGIALLVGAAGFMRHLKIAESGVDPVQGTGS